MAYLNQFQIYLESNDLPSFIQLWQEYCLSDELDTAEAVQILELIKNSAFKSALGPYIQDLLPLAETLADSEIKDNILESIFELQTTNDPTLATFAINYLAGKYPEDPHREQRLRIIGLRDKVSFPNALQYYRTLFHLQKGNFLMHTGGWGIGEVMDISTLREQITMEFDYSAGFKELSFINACKTLIPVCKDHFLAQRFGDIDNFEAKAKEHPVTVMKELLKDLGPKTAAEVKTELCDVVIPEKEWTKWWQSARSKMKKDPSIVSPTSLQDPFYLSETDLSYEDQLLKELSQKPNVSRLIEVLFNFLRDFPKSVKNPPFQTALTEHIDAVFHAGSLEMSEQLQLLFLLQQLGRNVSAFVHARIEDLHNPLDVLLDMSLHAHRKQLLQLIREQREDWAQIYTHTLLPIDNNALKDFILKELIQENQTELIEKTLNQLLDHPSAYPGSFLWYLQLILKRDDIPLSDQEGKCRFLEAFFALLYHMEGDQKQRDIVKRMLQLLAKSRFSMIRIIFKDASIEFVREILLLASKCQTLSSHDLKLLHSLAQVVHPELGETSKEDEEDGTIWTTQAGYEKLQQRIEEIGTKETVANAKEIEIARSHGDLRENSDYKFALEKRRQLQTELRFLSRQFSNMRVLTEEDIDTSKVSIGTVVSLKNAAGDEKQYIFLGPWDVDPEEHILSIQSKIGTCLEGMTIGDTCMLNNEEWTITQIQSHLNT